MTTLARLLRFAMAISLIGLCSIAPVGGQQAEKERRGLWLLPRKDPENSARADVPGRMKTAPGEVWRYGGDRSSWAYLAPVRVDGKDAYLAQVRSGLRLIRPDGTIVWDDAKKGIGQVLRIEDFDGDGSPEALVTLGTTGVALINVATGVTRWSWETPTGSFVVTYQVWRQGKDIRFICFPQNAVRGICLDLTHKESKPRILWDRPYPDTFWQGFGPLIVLADMNNDRIDDVVLAGKPGYVAVIDAKTGVIRCESRHDITGGDHAGRPYGLLQATDLDGDGFKDVVMLSCQVEEYAMIVRNDGGKGLKAVWSQFLEHDLPDDFRELRPNITSVADVDGDGKAEIVVGLFNITGDKRWHTVVLDPMKGFEAQKADLPDRFFWGCYDLDGDGRKEIITSTEKERRTASASTLQAVDGRTFKDVATLENAALSTIGGGPLPDDTGFMASRATPIFLETPKNGKGLLLVKRDGKAIQSLWRIRKGVAESPDIRLSPVSFSVMLSTGNTRLDRLDRTIRVPEGSRALAATGPLVGISGGRRELVFALANGTVMGGQPDLKQSGKFRQSWTVPGSSPALWVGATGERVVCTLQENALLLSRPVAGQKDAPSPLSISLPYPFYRNSLTRSGPTLLPFGNDTLQVFVGLQTGVHTMASALYDGSGKQLWLDDKEGPYPRTAAAATLDDTGKFTLISDNHGKHLLYDEDGKKRVIAHGWHDTIPGRSDGAKYVVPIVGPFGAKGETLVVMAPGLQSLETLDAQGRRVSKSDFGSTYEFEWCGSTVAKPDAQHGWAVGMANKDGIFYCMDAVTCKPRWTLDLGCRATLPINIAAGDIDGDGRDNYLVGLPNGNLVALEEKEGRGAVLWTYTFDIGIRDVIVADVDGDGFAEIIVETEEGCIRVLASR